MNPPSRRAFLASAGAIVAPSGCLDGGSPTDSPDGATPTASDPASTPTNADPTATATPPATDSETESPPATDAATETETPPPDSPAVAWQRRYDDSVTADPVVGEDLVVAGSESGTIRAYDHAGAELWTVEESVPVQDLAMDDGTLLALLGTNELSSSQTVHALDASSGRERWSFSPTDWWLEVLAVENGIAYVATADDVLEETGETLYALAVDDGEPRWSASIGDPREAVLTDDAVYVASTGRTYAVDRADGSERWDRPAEEIFTTLAAVDGTVVYAIDSETEGRYSELLGLDAVTGEEQWRFDSWAVTTTVAGDGDLFVGGARTASLDPTDGTVRWEHDTPGFLTDESLDAQRLYAGGDSLVAYDRESGGGGWSWTPDPPQGAVSAAGITDGTLYLDSYHDADVRNQYKFAVEVDSDTGQWAFENETELTDLAVGAGLTATGGKDGRLYALR